jgi:hypothetical protein
MTLALIVCIIGGGIVYYLGQWDKTTPRFGELGRLAFFAGLLAYLLKG